MRRSQVNGNPTQQAHLRIHKIPIKSWIYLLFRFFFANSRMDDNVSSDYAHTFHVAATVPMFVYFLLAQTLCHVPAMSSRVAMGKGKIPIGESKSMANATWTNHYGNEKAFTTCHLAAHQIQTSNANVDRFLFASKGVIGRIRLDFLPFGFYYVIQYLWS